MRIRGRFTRNPPSTARVSHGDTYIGHNTCTDHRAGSLSAFSESSLPMPGISGTV